MADPDCEELQSTKEYRSSGLPIERFARMLNYNASCVPALSYQSTQTHAIAESSDRFEGTGSDSCRWADDEACDEPGLCAVGTDETDCATRDWIPGHDAVTSTDAWWIDRCPPDSPTCDDDAGVWVSSGLGWSDLKSRPEVCGDPWTARPQCLRDAGRPWDDFGLARDTDTLGNEILTLPCAGFGRFCTDEDAPYEAGWAWWFFMGPFLFAALGIPGLLALRLAIVVVPLVLYWAEALVNRAATKLAEWCPCTGCPCAKTKSESAAEASAGVSEVGRQSIEISGPTTPPTAPTSAVAAAAAAALFGQSK